VRTSADKSSCSAFVSVFISGTLLASGSDDTNICLWSQPRNQLLIKFPTGHTANIFCVKFMPGTGAFQKYLQRPSWCNSDQLSCQK
jgi:WD40 repeat protein